MRHGETRGNHGGYYGHSPATAAVAGADVNGDGKVDLLGANQAGFGASGFVSVRLQDSSQPGGLQAPLRSSAGTNPASLAVGSLGGSALPGVVVVNQQAQPSINPANTVSVLQPGTRPGTFLAPVPLGVGSRSRLRGSMKTRTCSNRDEGSFLSASTRSTATSRACRMSSFPGRALGGIHRQYPRAAAAPAA